MMNDAVIHISRGKGYHYKHCWFEWHDWLGPLAINRVSHEPRNPMNLGYRTYSIWNKFGELSKEEREQYRIY